MPIAEATAGEALAQDPGKDRLAALERLANLDTSLANLTQDDLARLIQIKDFIAWHNDPRPAFQGPSSTGDKFAKLVALSRKHPACVNFYSAEVGVDATTVWRWSVEKSRPSKFAGTQLAREIEVKVRDALWEMAYESGLLTKAVIAKSVTATA